MQNNTQHKPIIGIVLSTVPRYSETFFRNKIGFEFYNNYLFAASREGLQIFQID